MEFQIVPDGPVNIFIPLPLVALDHPALSESLRQRKCERTPRSNRPIAAQAKI